MRFKQLIRQDIEHFLQEDDLGRQHDYHLQLPEDKVQCSLKIKSDVLVAGLPHFFAVFDYLGAQLPEKIEYSIEGEWITEKENHELKFMLPFDVALNGERLALNLLAQASRIATFTKSFVDKAKKYHIAIMDTRKTTPGLRSLEKYAVRVGGGHNHRFGQSDLWMIKDNHKSFFGGLEGALKFFRARQNFYTPIVVEIHNIAELNQAIDLEVKHVMLDNFSVADVKKGIDMKLDGMSYEVSGGLSEETFEDYLIPGVDALSIGRLTYGAPPVDFSLKYKRPE